MRNRCCYWGNLAGSSPGEYASFGKLAVGRGFEPIVQSRNLAYRATILLRNDWLPCLIGALL
jgi:hypothetical protein